MNKEEKIALFKFQLISPVLNDRSINQKEYFTAQSQKEFELPFSGKKKFKACALKKWLMLYRKQGFEGLKPKIRKDKGVYKAVSDELKGKVREVLLQNEFKTVRNVYLYLLKNRIIEENTLSYATLNTYVRREKLLEPTPPKARKAYEAEHINQLWLSDFMYGPYVQMGKSKKQSYLCAIIDDYSRLIVSASFFEDMGSLSLEETLKKAVKTYGLPNKFYCDNGKVFASEHLQLLSARLKFALIHSKPYDAPSRGKIERFFRTVRTCFLENFYARYKGARPTLEDLNREFRNWLQHDYNLKEHSAIAACPIDRYLENTRQIKLRKLDAGQLDLIFYHTFYRVVKKDCTIHFKNALYEVPPQYVSKKVEIRFDPCAEKELFLFADNQLIKSLKLLNKQENSKSTLKFNQEEKHV